MIKRSNGLLILNVCIAISALILIGIFVSAVLNFALSGISKANNRYSGKCKLNEYEVRISRWIDGDTFVGDINLGLNVVLVDEKVRLNGVDTPERGEADFDVATNISKSTCPSGYVYELIVYGRDKYGRVLGDVICNGVKLNDRLEARGWVYDK